MTPTDDRERENRFEDVCKFAAALVAVGLIVFAGETAMHRIPEAGPVEPASAAAPPPSSDYFSDHYRIDPSAKAEPHIEAF